ncbi:MAG TPA: hypothetical protein PLA68_15700, partial [Panacibacter sp.]|nr:hypothetical protein [Panacibacter sp.]
MAKITEYRRCLLLLLCFLCLDATAQKTCRLIIQAVDGYQQTINELQLTSQFYNKATCIAYVQQLPVLLNAKGYISASIDSAWDDSASVNIRLFPGKKYEWENLQVSERDWPLLNQLGYYRNTFNNK